MLKQLHRRQKQQFCYIQLFQFTGFVKLIYTCNVQCLPPLGTSTNVIMSRVTQIVLAFFYLQVASSSKTWGSKPTCPEEQS